MKLVWPLSNKRRDDQIEAETLADQLKAQLEERRQRLLKAALELSKGVDNGR
jgi:ATP-dependent protease HslVU (ClpYQ) peptidase subunit